jgi:nucleoside-diphosphate-sugar epimerase
MGWRHKIELEEGIKLAYQDFVRMLENIDSAKRM